MKEVQCTDMNNAKEKIKCCTDMNNAKEKIQSPGVLGSPPFSPWKSCLQSSDQNI